MRASQSHPETMTYLPFQMCSFGRGFKRISMFNVDGAEHTVSVVLWDGNHYDILCLKDGSGNLMY
jgi:hypothetical protein